MLWKKEDGHEFKPEIIEIEEKPVSPIGRFILWTVIISFLFILAWLFFAKIDVVVSARGVVVPEEEVKVIQPLDSGVITKIYVRPGDFVNKGQPLIELDPAITEPELKLIKEKIHQLEISKQRIKSLIYEKPFILKDSDDFTQTQERLYYETLEAYRARIKTFESRKKELLENIKKAEIQLEMTQKLLDKSREQQEKLNSVRGIVPEQEIKNLEKEIIKLESQIKSLEKEKYSIKLQIIQTDSELISFKRNFKENLFKELAENEKQLSELKNRLKQIRYKHKKQILVSPVDGWVKQLTVYTIGAVVSPAERIMTIVPANNKLLVKAMVENKDIGYIKEGMKVKVKLEAYNFQKYGTLPGTISIISKDSIEDEVLGRIYETYIELEKECLAENKCAKPGMTVTAEIDIGKRRVIEFFIYPVIRYLDEGLSVR
ncbi:HlyD family type I secretion periplasmic adaptor subunit [Persephonella sp.]